MITTLPPTGDISNPEAGMWVHTDERRMTSPSGEVTVRTLLTQLRHIFP